MKELKAYCSGPKHQKGYNIKLVEIEVDGNPKNCPQCGCALFYSSKPKRLKIKSKTPPDHKRDF